MFYFSYSVSNEVPEHPVISPVSGSIFEKRLIEKYVLENGVDPINGKDLAVDQLIEVKGKSYNTERKSTLSFLFNVHPNARFFTLSYAHSKAKATQRDVHPGDS